MHSPSKIVNEASIIVMEALQKSAQEVVFHKKQRNKQQQQKNRKSHPEIISLLLHRGSL